MSELTRRGFVSRAFAGIAGFGMVSGLSEPLEAQLVWSTSEGKLASFEELLRKRQE